MKKVAIIGGGISGLSTAHFLRDRYEVVVFEKENIHGGLIRCMKVNGNLFHTCGGHVFNSKRQDVLDWFWRKFDQNTDFLKTDRNSVVYMDGGKYIPYPIENHVYLFDDKIQRHFIADLIDMVKTEREEPNNFEEFLKYRFGPTLYDLYFKPYNEKVWRRELSNVPLSWLEGKLPMPTASEMIYNNMNHIEEKSFVHSTFWYEKKNGSQFIADQLAKGLRIHYGCNIDNVEFDSVAESWQVNGERFDTVIYCGNIKDLVQAISGIEIPEKYRTHIDGLQFHGTTSVFCEIDSNPYSWIYQPSYSHRSHRIICTGNFSAANNFDLNPGRITATIEFTDEISLSEIIENLEQMPLNPKYLSHVYNKYTYPIQDINTRDVIKSLKGFLAGKNIYLTGRFADWEYYNMDAAIGAAMDLCKTL